VCFLEFCNGGDMEAMLSSENRALNNRQLLVFTTQVASGLQFLHSQNIAHRYVLHLTSSDRACSLSCVSRGLAWVFFFLFR
jgi:hypothetical protein